MLPPHSRLRSSAEIGLVRQRGQRWQHPLVVLFVYTQPQPTSSVSRFAIAVGRHIGKAARRNKVKRRLREVLRHHLHKLAPGYDCLIVARSGTVEANYRELETALVQLLIRSKVLIDEPGDSAEVDGSLS